MRSRLLTTTAALAALAPAAAAWAADEAPAGAPNGAQAPVSELVITATRLPTSIDLVTGARVIDREELQARQTPFIQDVLATVPGVALASNGGFGGLSAIRIRGASPDKTLVLIDGVPVNNVSDPNGAFDPSSLQTADVERIEILSGPQGSLWGSDAIGGVVSITTREIRGFEAEVEGGTYRTARGFVGAGVGDDRYALSATIAGLETDGFSKADTGTEDDPFRTVSANVSGRVKLTDAVQLEAHGRYGYSKVAIDGFPAPDFTLADTPDVDRIRTWQGDLRALVDAAGFHHTLLVSDYHFRLKETSDFPSDNRAERQVFRWTAERGGPGDAYGLAVGAERDDTRADLSGRGEDNLSTTSVFATGRLRPWTPLTLTGSLRYDDPDQFKARATGRLAAAVDLGEGFTLTASAGQGFKTPTISEVLCDFCFSPPVPLKPEHAEGYDLRLGWTSPDQRLTAAVTAYRLNVRDQIRYIDLHYVNVARTRSDGVEAEADARLSRAWRVKLAYSWTEAVDETTETLLQRVPRHAGSAALFYDDGPWSGALTIRAESSQLDVDRDGFTPVQRPGFAVADIAGAYKVNDQITLTARVENLTDKRYEETFGFNEAGRMVWVGLRLTP